MSDTRNDDAPTLEQHTQHAQHAQQPDPGWAQAPAPGPGPGPGQPAGPTAWYGATASPRAGRRRPPWSWPVIAIAVGLAALLAGGGAGFAIGHAIGTHHTQSTPQFPGQGTNRFPGKSGGTGTDCSTGTGGTGTDGTGS